MDVNAFFVEDGRVTVTAIGKEPIDIWWSHVHRVMVADDSAFMQDDHTILTRSY